MPTIYTISPEELQTLLEAAANMGAKVARGIKNRNGAAAAENKEFQAWASEQLAAREAWEAARARKSVGLATTYPGTKTIVK